MTSNLPSQDHPWLNLRRRLGGWSMGALAFGVIAYSVIVLMVVTSMGDIGVRCVFGTVIKEEISPLDFEWTAAHGGDPDRPRAGDRLVRIGPPVGVPPASTAFKVIPIEQYPDYVQALRELSAWFKAGISEVEVSWEPRDRPGTILSARAKLRDRPWTAWIRTLVWFAQELVIFAVGAWVSWRRPHDESARLFFWLCLVTVGAFMGGYHWSAIVVVPPLIYLFAAFALFVPIVSLHFYLVFPRANPIYALYRRQVLTALYGVPIVYLAALWSSMLWLYLIKKEHGPRAAEALAWVRGLALGYVGLAAVIFGLCIVCLVWSFRRARNRRERNQVKWILGASLLAAGPIGVLLWQVGGDASTLARDNAAWLMFAVSLLYTVAYALSITRYKLMQVDEILSRGMLYVAVSVSFGLLYSGALVISALVIGDTLLTNQTSRQAMVAGVTSIVALILTGAARERFQKVIDRRFFREKYQFDKAMRQMSLAVGRLVDRPTLGRRLLDAAGEVLRLDWGAVYLAERPGEPFSAVASLGPEPDDPTLSDDNPLVRRLRSISALRVSHTLGRASGGDHAIDALIALGGEAVAALVGADGNLAGMLVLGPKRSGLPYDDEELAFLSALSSVATLALHSSGTQQTLERLNDELRIKVEKIAEQQRRILILQDQLVRRHGPDAATDPIGEGDTLPVHADDVDGNPTATGFGSVPSGASETDWPSSFESIKGSGPSIRRMLSMVRKVAVSPSAVLIRGESGTGKELLAEAIHAVSPRHDGPFVKVHCAALTQTLLESELFGHVKGAFTGADRDRIGRFQQADGGTLFLDEIGDINLEVQTKLLRVLQEMEFERVGSSQSIRVDVRLVAATHQDLEALIRAGRFREDLYYRLNVISIRTPSLRERKEDIFELAVHFLRHHSARAGKPVTRIDDSAIEALMAYDWPGNVRELENVIERAVVLTDGSTITRADLPPDFGRSRLPLRRRLVLAAATPSRVGPRPPGASRYSTSGPNDPLPSPSLEASDQELDPEAEAFQKARLLDALDETQGNKSAAARLLGMPRSTFFSQMKKYDLL